MKNEKYVSFLCIKQHKNQCLGSFMFYFTVFFTMHLLCCEYCTCTHGDVDVKQYITQLWWKFAPECFIPWDLLTRASMQESLKLVPPNIPHICTLYSKFIPLCSSLVALPPFVCQLSQIGPPTTQHSFRLYQSVEFWYGPQNLLLTQTHFKYKIKSKWITHIVFFHWQQTTIMNEHCQNMTVKRQHSCYHGLKRIRPLKED